MSPRFVVRCAVLLAVAYAHALSAHTASSQQSTRPDQQAPPPFRSGVTAIPIDVRVVDKDGRPISGLRQEDFTIIEDGVPQTITHFAAETLVAQAPRSALRAGPDTPAFAGSTQNYRVFLIVLGVRGLGDTQRHPETLNALLDFVRHKLLPQDQVALFASNRGVDFTSDHEKVARRLEAFREAPAPAKPTLTQPIREVSGNAGAAFANPAASVAEAPIDTELGFEDYIKARGGEPLNELESLFFGINYLRFMEGEKHLIFVTERGPVPTWDEADAVVRAASNARVALNTIQSDRRIGDTMIANPPAVTPPQHEPAIVGGRLPYAYDAGAPELRPPLKPWTKPSIPEPIASPLREGESTALPTSAAQLGFGGIYDLRHIAMLTGGQSSIWKEAAPALSRIDDATRIHYLLAYYPTNSDWNGSFRSVTVKVNRPGATVLFRHGYSALSEIEGFDRRRVVTNSRIEAAGSRMSDIRDLEVSATPSFKKNASGPGGEVTIPISIDAVRLGWAEDADGRHTAALDVVIYCADDNQKSIGQLRRKLTLALTDETYERTLKERISRTMRVAVTGKPRYVKVIVYNYDADRVGSVMVKVK